MFLFSQQQQTSAQLNRGRFERTRAFTLLELMVAMAVFSFVMLAIYASWTAILRGSKIGLDEAAKVQRARVAVKAVEDALVTAQLFAGPNVRYYEFVTDTTTDPNFHFLSCVSKLPPESFPGSGMFDPGAPRRVTFEVLAGEDGKNELVMTQIPMMAVTNETIQPYPIVLVRDCSLFFMEFWDAQRGVWGVEHTNTNAL
ncbi:MAG: type II secretion system protein J, partial [Limisphaerales bacterium]